MIFAFTVIAILSPSAQFCAEAKEIVATKEWQQLQEGDTIPQGLHVKMDLSTGMKWVKLLSEEEEKADIAIKGDGSQVAITNTEQAQETNVNPKEAKESLSPMQHAIKITQLANAELSADASAKITSQLLKQAERQANVIESIASLNDFQGDTTTEELEYEMMYRTLLSLPREEIEGSGLDLPTIPAKNASEDEKSGFEKQIRAIWNVRQDLLKNMEEEYITDVTDIIAERIESLKDYLGDPGKHVRHILTMRESSVNEDMDTNKNTNADTDDDDDGDDLSLTTGVLKDLEFQLIDLDNARDFHSMGGWPILVAFVTESIHGLEYELQKAIAHEAQSLNEGTYNATEGSDVAIELPEDAIEFLKEYQRVVWEIQGLACWCMGTAVKNVEEFSPWAIEADLMRLNADGGIVNVITIILNKLHAERGIGPSTLGMSTMDDKLQMRRKYEMYALRALLRGNKEAIHNFSSVNGPSILYDLYSYFTVNAKQMSSIDSTTLKLLSKIVALADDLIMDATLHPSENSEIDNQLVSALTTSEWCMVPIQMMNYPSIHMQRKMLETMINTSLHCTYMGDPVVLIREVCQSELNDEKPIDEELESLINKLQNKLT